MDNTGVKEYIARPKTKVQKPKQMGKLPKSIGSMSLARLLPFKPYMILGLRKKGFDTSKLDFKNLVALYYNEIGSQKNNRSSPYVPVNINEFTNSFLFKISPRDNINGSLDDTSNRVELGNIDALVDSIIELFRTAKEKKEYAISQGVNPKTVLSDAELLQAKGAVRIQKSLENKVFYNKEIRLGQVKDFIILGLVLFLFWKLFE